MGRVKADCRRDVFGRHVMTFQFQGWYPGVANKLREQLAPLLSNEPDAVKRPLQPPFERDWPFPCSCKGRRVVKPPVKDSGPVQNWRSAPGCPACRRHVVLVIRGVTQLARRLKISDNPSRNWMSRATHSSDEGRFPFAKRWPECATARRLVRGHPDADGSVDLWSGEEAGRRPAASCPDGEPRAEPSSPAKPAVVLKRRASFHARKGESSDADHSPPSRANPLCGRGLSREEVKKLHGRSGAADWWGQRVPVRSCAVRLQILRCLARIIRVVRPGGARVGAGLQVSDLLTRRQIAW